MTEKFAAYGLSLDIPNDWRIEFNPKITREKGDVAFHSPKNNILYVSWGKLEAAERRFSTLEQQRDESAKLIRRNPNVKRADVETSSKEEVAGHEALLSKMVAQRRPGFFSRSEQPTHDIWLLHLRCPQSSRYYVVYWDIREKEEYPDVEERFLAVARSFACHSKSEP